MKFVCALPASLAAEHRAIVGELEHVSAHPNTPLYKGSLHTFLIWHQ